MKRNILVARGRRLKRPGFSLVEAAVATAIIGVGVVALLMAVGSGTKVNGAGQNLNQAVFLAQEVREWSLTLPFVDPNFPTANPGADTGENPQTFVNDLDDLLEVTYCPPRDGRGQQIAEMPTWSQHIDITWRDPDQLTRTLSVPGTSDVVYVEVTVSNRDVPVLKTGWLVAKRR